MKNNSNNKYLYAGIATFGILFFALNIDNSAIGQNSKAPKQKIVAAPVNYWMDISNGGRSMMPNLPFGIGKAGENHFGDAYTGIAGKHTDIAIFHKDFPRKIEANQAIPKGARMGNSIPLLPNPPSSGTTNQPNYQDEERPQTPPEMKDFKISFYWGCGATVKSGQPKIFQIRNGQWSNSMQGIQSRAERDRGAGQNAEASFWPNSRDSRNYPDNSSLVGDHAVTGNNLPPNIRFALDNSSNFLSDLGLSSTGNTGGNITISWNNVAGAEGYFINAMGFRGMGENNGEMIIFSASDVPDMGHGLLNYLSAANISKFISERAILPPSQTSCQIPSGIFANTQMVMVRGIGYGHEVNMIYPARPTDVSIPWIQQWSARFRNKTMGTLMVGMPGLGSYGNNNAPTSQSTSRNSQNSQEPQANKPNTENAANCQENQELGSTIGSAIGRGLGQRKGGALGRIAGNAIGNVAGRTAGAQTNPCQPQNNGN